MIKRCNTMIYFLFKKIKLTFIYSLSIYKSLFMLLCQIIKNK